MKDKISFKQILVITVCVLIGNIIIYWFHDTFSNHNSNLSISNCPSVDKIQALPDKGPMILNLEFGQRLKSFDLLDSSFTTSESPDCALCDQAKRDSAINYYRTHGDTLKIYSSDKVSYNGSPPMKEKKLVYVFIQH